MRFSQREGETKAKSLSLQQYRQMRQKRQPLVEKQGNYTTKWPSVSEPPKELTPILCLQGQNSPGPKAAHRYPDSRIGGAAPLHRSQTPANKTPHTSAPPRFHPAEAKQSTPLHRTGLKRPRTKSKMISPASPLPGVTLNPSVSPVKKVALLSSDPPNPVLLPLPLRQTSSPSTEGGESKEEFNRDSNLDSTRHFQETQNESSGTPLQPQPSSVGQKPEVLSVNQDSTTPFQEVKIRFTKTASGSLALCPTPTQTQPSSEGPVTAHDSNAVTECKQQASIGEVNTTIIRAATQHLPEEPKTRPEANQSTNKVLAVSDSATTDQDCGRTAEDKPAPCTIPTPPPSPPARGRDKRRYQRRSPRSDSSSSSCSSSSSSSSSSASRSPKRQKRRHKRSESSSCSSSPSRSPPCRYRWSYSRSGFSRSRSRSWSQSRSPSRSRSPSPRICRRPWRDVYRSRESRKLRREHEIRIQKLKAIDERRVVYVGRICRSMTHDELRERFSQFGEVECVSLHFRERGDHYGFVTFYNMDDAFAAIDNGGKLRRPDELPFDLCFGGRRQFCNSDYADLDANRDAEASPAKNRFEDLDFDQLLKQAQRGLKR
ncbi:Peroxisome proliferator-activated receptor gamma coactivator-related protein 1 [Nibea albiflora]|uniref:Peroxisome proliferator-activated receptor gamma coactivator-related protein 1 n=1 Tax=Nibea albiflora TaxID=240163 RepID=A0ACB7FLU6_NIBAL|nr:Peroxisome proliferator-activated receptor gamma coactivator-related protein 1 [Nibea albiflora]